MKRKLIKQGRQAYTITLPIEWVRQNNLDKESEIELIPHGKDLILNSGNPVKGKSISFDFNGLKNRSMYLHLSAAYIYGADEIHIKSDEDISQDIYRITKVLSGFVLTKQTSNEYIISDIHPGFYSSLDEIFKRLYQMILESYNTAILDIFGDQKETKDGAFHKDMEINKFCFYLQRAVNKMAFNNKIEENVVFTYSYFLEEVGDEIRKMWFANIGGGVKKTDKIKKLVEKTRQMLEKSFFIYFQYNKKGGDEIFIMRDVARKLYEEIGEMNTETVEFARHVINIADFSADMAQMGILKNL